MTCPRYPLKAPQHGVCRTDTLMLFVANASPTDALHL